MEGTELEAIRSIRNPPPTDGDRRRQWDLLMTRCFRDWTQSNVNILGAHIAGIAGNRMRNGDDPSWIAPTDGEVLVGPWRRSFLELERRDLANETEHADDLYLELVEAFQYWIVDEWLAERLNDAGEPVIRFADGYIWCRWSCGHDEGIEQHLRMVLASVLLSPSSKEIV
jgi:hypothetical protein